MDQDLIVPRVAFVINLAPSNSRQLSPTRLRHLIQLFESQRITATWAASDASTLKPLREQSDRQLLRDVALKLEAKSSLPKGPARDFNAAITAQIQSLSCVTGSAPSAVVGDASQLRHRSTILSQIGIEAIVDTSRAAQQRRPRAIGCGIWQLSTALQLPMVGWKQRLLRRKPSTRQIPELASEGFAVVSIDATALEQHSLRHMQSIEKFLKETSWAASRGQLEIVSLGEIAAGLNSQNQVKPQQSILRVAA